MASPIAELAKNRPAETAMPLATVLAALIAKLVGVEDTDTILYIALALSFVPAAVTWMVELMRKSENNPVKETPVEAPVEAPVDAPVEAPTPQTLTKPPPVKRSSKRKPDAS